MQNVRGMFIIIYMYAAGFPPPSPLTGSGLWPIGAFINSRHTSWLDAVENPRPNHNRTDGESTGEWRQGWRRNHRGSVEECRGHTTGLWSEFHVYLSRWSERHSQAIRESWEAIGQVLILPRYSAVLYATECHHLHVACCVWNYLKKVPVFQGNVEEVRWHGLLRRIYFLYSFLDLLSQFMSILLMLPFVLDKLNW